MNTIPRFVKLAAGLLSFIVFLVGFWHSHLGLKEMRPFDSEYGSLIIATIILLLVLISYYIALNGKKLAILFYIIGGLLFFIFNLNYFYPSYLGRKLINEEADFIKEKLDTEKNYLNSISVPPANEYVSKLNNLWEIKNNILTEISDRGGFGTHATNELNNFKSLTGSKLTGERSIAKTEAEKIKLYFDWDEKLNDAILFYIATTIPGDDKNKLEIVYANFDLDEFYKIYKPKLDSIANDEKRVILDSLKHESYYVNTQIKDLKIVADKLSQTKIRVNTALNKKADTSVFEKDVPKSRYLGKFEHTLKSVSERINRIDTWGIIVLCLFIDLLIPLFIYVMIREKNDENGDAESDNRDIGKRRW